MMKNHKLHLQVVYNDLQGIIEKLTYDFACVLWNFKFEKKKIKKKIKKGNYLQDQPFFF